MAPQNITNFGRNISFSANDVFTPQNEAELLDVMARCRGRKIRVIGRLHSWSETVVTEDVLLDLRHLNTVRVENRNRRKWVTVGAGCQIKRLLSELERQEAGTTPSLGLITEQAIAGAMSTGTHGSGKHSLSHYADEIQIAVYDPATGLPVIRTVTDGDELRAARCALGALGVIVSVGFWARPAYNVEEHFVEHGTLEDVVAQEADYPLQQFYLIPWRWRYITQHRREVDAPRSRFASAYRWYFFLTIDVGLHVTLLLLARILRSPACTRFFFRNIAPRTVIQRWKVVDRSQEMLIMEHELFRHIEIEIFMKASQLADSLAFVKEFIRHFDGDKSALSSAIRQQMEGEELWGGLDDLCGSYTHHYQICVRRVLPDDTLISMASSVDEAYYSLSFISYARPNERQGFFAFADRLCQAMVALFNGRPHWGKYCPLASGEAADLYPHLPRFRQICEQLDAGGIFRNNWINRLLWTSEANPGVEYRGN